MTATRATASIQPPPPAAPAACCPVCGGNDLSTYSDGADATLTAADLGSSRQSVAHGRILRCRTCRFGFRQSRPSEAELAGLYRDLDPTVYEREAYGRTRIARRHLKIVERFARPGTLLDAGCASGAFLRCAADAGWKITGVEPSEVLSAKAQQTLAGRGLVLCAPLQRANLRPSSFTAITLWDVLEHVPDPRAFLEHCAALLKPGGHLFVNVPDLDSLQARLLGQRWPLLLAEHLNYFNRSSLKLCAEMAGLRWVSCGRRRAAFSLDYVLYRLAQHSIPGAALAYRTIGKTFAGACCVPAFLGETYAVFIRPAHSLA